MDMEKDKDRFLLQLADDLSFEELQDLCYSKDANQFYSARLADWFVDKINYGWRLWQAAKAQAVPEWISVEDKLPPANILVLGMSQTPRNIFNIYNVMALDEFEEADVTHWMPLPDAPQEPAND